MHMLEGFPIPPTVGSLFTIIRASLPSQVRNPGVLFFLLCASFYLIDKIGGQLFRRLDVYRLRRPFLSMGLSGTKGKVSQETTKS
jgi:hypothetical protein